LVSQFWPTQQTEKVMLNIQIPERLSNFLHAAVAVSFGLAIPVVLAVHVFVAGR
jgi:hypothetical protein